MFFFDTSVICDYLTLPERLVKNPDVQERVKKTHQLFEIFKQRDQKDQSKKLWFYVSAITITELRKFQRSEDVLSDIVNLVNTGNVVFVDFSKEVAEYLHKNFTSYLSDNSLREFTANLEKLTDMGAMSARKWIDDDVKIAGTAKMVRKLDALLTGDYKTFLPVAKQMGLPVYYTKDIPVDMFGELKTEW